MHITNKNFQIVILIVLFSLVLFFILLRQNYKTVIRQLNFYKENSLYWQESYFSNFSNTKIHIDSTLIINKDGVFNNKKGFPKLILYYPDYLCGVCEKDLFETLNRYPNKYLIENMIVLIPNAYWNEFLIYLKRYNLKFRHYYAYKSNLCKFPIRTDGAVLFIIDTSYEVSNILIPRHPINDEVVLYFRSFEKEFCRKN